MAGDPRRRLAPRHRRAVRRRRTQPGPRADDRRRRVRGRPDRRTRHGEHRDGRTVATPPGGTSRWAGTVIESVAADGFSIFVGGPDGTRATVLSALRPTDLPAWGWTLPVGGGTYHGLFPAGLAGVRTRCPGRPRDRRAALARHRGRPDAECAACRGIRMVAGEPRARPLDGRAHVHVGRSPGGRRTPSPPPPRRRPRRRRRRGSAFGDPGDDAPTALRGSLSIAARGGDGIELTCARLLRPGDRHGALGGLRCGRPARCRRHRPRRRRRPDARRGRGRRCGRGRDRRPRARRATVDPVRDRLGPADGRVRGGPSLVEALHAGLGSQRPACLGPGHARARGAARLAAPDRGLAGALPRGPRAAGLVQDGPVQRAVLPRRRRLVLGARRGRAAGAAGRPRGPVRPPRVPRLPVLRHGRCRLLRVVRDP